MTFVADSVCHYHKRVETTNVERLEAAIRIVRADSRDVTGNIDQ